MSQQQKLEQILELLVNEESSRAEDLLHQLVVEKARTIYEELVNEDENIGDEMEAEIEESVGGDPKGDFVSEVEADEDDIESDELNDGEAEEDDDDDDDADYDSDGDGYADDGEGDDEFGDGDGIDDVVAGEMEGGVEEKVMDLESQLDDLRMAFTKLMADEMEEPYHDEEEMGDMMGDLEGGAMAGAADADQDLMSGMYEDLDEATKLQDKVPEQNMKQEGQAVGTGDHTKTGSTGTESPYTKAPSKNIDANGAKATDWNKGGTGGEYTGPSGGDSEDAKDFTPSSNMNEKPKANTSGAKDHKSEGNFVGTGKHSQKGATQTQSPFTQAPKK